MARHERVRDLIPLGAYVPGADPVTDRAVQQHPHIEEFLCQGTKEAAPFGPCIEQLERLSA
jgi:flagellum-specific ATP synthase